jgi:hypothetical protein
MTTTTRNLCAIIFLGLLTHALIALKAANVIAWSWWWILSPVLGLFALLVIALVSVVICYLLKKHFIDRIPSGF